MTTGVKRPVPYIQKIQEKNISFEQSISFEQKSLECMKWKVLNVDDDIPLLVMLINPSDLNVNLKKIITRTRTKGGFTEEHWGNDINSITANGKTAMFYGDKGITTKDRRLSEAMANFKKLFDIYRNNGVQFDESGNIAKVGRIRMFWHTRIYDGFFESFSINEESEEPFTFSYDFVFKILKSYGGYSLSKTLSSDNMFQQEPK